MMFYIYIYVAQGLVMVSTLSWPLVSIEDGGMVGYVPFPWEFPLCVEHFLEKKDVWGIFLISLGMAI